MYELFNVLELRGFSYGIIKFMIVTLKNDAKTKWSLLEGIYEISAAHNGLPTWKMMGGPHEIKAVNNMWYISKDGSNQKFYTHDQPLATEKLPDDPLYNWQMHDGSQWVETVSGDVKIQGT